MREIKLKISKEAEQELRKVLDERTKIAFKYDILRHTVNAILECTTQELVLTGGKK